MNDAAQLERRALAHTTGRSSRLAGISAIALACTLAAPVVAQDAPQVAQPIASPASGQAAGQVYTPEDFARYAPKTALDMISQIPGFSITGGDNGERGLGQASQNILINGQRMSGKSNDAATALSRIDASSVTRIEILDGASLSIPGLSGQVANVVAEARKFGGSFKWKPQIRPGLKDVWTAGQLSLNGSFGKTDWTLGLTNDVGRQGHRGPEYAYDAAGTLLVTRQEYGRYNYNQPKVNASIARTADNGNILNLNGQYTDAQARESVYGDIVEQAGPIYSEAYTGGEDEYNYELGGDYEFALGGGRLKLIGLRRFEHSPFYSRFVSDQSGSDKGSLFNQTVDEGESILRGEYGWKAGSADWQVAFEGAYNTLVSTADLFDIDGATQTPVPLPGASAEIDEKRLQGSISHGRPLSDTLTLQATLGAEYSVIGVSGPDGDSRSFIRPKGSVAIAWRPSEDLVANAKLERKVDQLNFFDVLASVDVANNTGRGKNAGLVPPQRWNFTADIKKNLGAWGSIKPDISYSQISDYIEIIPISPTEEALGNVSSARAYSIGLEATILFDPIGWKGAKFDVYGNKFWSNIKDPLTGVSRPLSGQTKYNFGASLRHDIPGTDWAWGADVEHFEQSPRYRLTQIADGGPTRPYASVFIENKDVFGLTVRASVGNLFDSRDANSRTVYDGRRTQPIQFSEQREREFGNIWSFSISGKI